MKILSWNILANEFIKKRYYPMVPPEIVLNRKQRQIQILYTIKQMDMDVMLLQEVMQSEYNALTRSFQKTHYLLRGQNIKWQENKSYSGNVILLRKTLFAKPTIILLAFGVGVQCTYKNRPLFIFNIHLDDVSHPERIKQVSEIIPYFNASEQVIVGGDFNENYQAKNQSGLYKLLKTAGLKIYNRQPTYYIERKMCIDNILTKGIELKHQTAHVVDDFGGDVVNQFITYGSDHLPVVVN
jgi:endonuclease/exonuclease/phosphatase family metal-dependent hydrolase